MNENNNVYYDFDNNENKNTNQNNNSYDWSQNNDFLTQERKNEGYEIPHYQPQYNQAPPQENSGLAIASLVLGILSLVCCGSFLFSILAIVFYFVDKSNTGVPNRLAKTGMILGIVSLVLTVIFYIAYIGIFLGAVSEVGNYY